MKRQGNKSAEIRRLHDKGMSVLEISNAMGVRYQYVYNVVSHYVKQKAMKQNVWTETAAAEEVHEEEAPKKTWFQRLFSKSGGNKEEGIS